MKDWKGVREGERQGSAERGACIGAALMRGREKGEARESGEEENSLLCGVESSIFDKLLVPAALPSPPQTWSNFV